jgi:hypothetical protein
MHIKKQCRIFCAHGYGGTHFTRMLNNIVRCAMFVEEWESHPKWMRFPYTHRLRLGI